MIVATGESDGRKATKITEIFKWQNEDNSTCHLPDYPVAIKGAVTVMIGDKEYICGGYPWTTQCFSFIGDEAPFNLLHNKAGSSSVTINSTAFVFGGNDQDSYETISVDFAQSEGVLPFTLNSGCATLINITTMLLAGGDQDGTTQSKTWLYNFQTEEWTQGPSMIENRVAFGCGYIESINSVAAFGGYEPPKATTEILKLPGGSFKQGNCRCLFY